MDSLTYTRDGLSTPTSIDLRVGRHNRIVIKRPVALPIIESTQGGFQAEEAFPTPSVLAAFWRYARDRSLFSHGLEAPPKPPAGFAQLFAHADDTGSESSNKALTDRRANVALAMLCSDVEALRPLAAEDGWGAMHRQAMLRILGCDPGPIDGQPESLTKAAVAFFQRRYVERDFHRWAPDGVPLASPSLVEDGDLGPLTRDALIEAFVVANGAYLSAEALHPTHPANGCSAYNLATTSSLSANRRISLVVHPELLPHHDNAPCTQGDEQACAIVDDAAHRCLWFRTHVKEPAAPAPRFLDLRWLALDNGHYLLSALTTAVDDEDVTFEVYDAREPVDGLAAVKSELLSQPLSEPIVTRPNLGVAAVVWAPPAEIGRGADERPDVNGVPVFRVSHPASGSFCFASWPPNEVVRILVGAEEPEGPMPADRPESFRLRSTDGAYDVRTTLDAAVRFSPHHFVLEFPNAPARARYTLWCDFHAAQTFEHIVIDDATLEDLRSSCAEGKQCPAPPPPPEPGSHPDHDPHADAIVRLLEGAVADEREAEGLL